MKKSFILFATSLLVLAGCTKNQESDIQGNDIPESDIPGGDIPESGFTLVAKTESPTETKTVLETGAQLFWEPGDEIAVFMGEKSWKFVTDITAASETATFKESFGEKDWPEELDLWAVYPFSEETTFDGETITTTLPSEQIAREGSFGEGMNLAIAHSSSNSLQFYNVGGGLRFSVTETGIKKVMFESLSGEIISGKVKIGFENGLPVVQEVSGGSQFITLLPPIGQDTFQTNTWYYIVAIPGSLEGGCKLRFYKEDDYARKVSEGAMMIKRSVYGNLDKVDDGLQYEPRTSAFPVTDEEWEETESKILLINETMQKVLDHADILSDNTAKSAYVINEALRIEGIASAEPSEKREMVFLQMENGVYINVLINGVDDVFGASTSSFDTVSQQNYQSRSTDTPHYPSGKKALVLLPIYDEVVEHELYGASIKRSYDAIISSLEKCGFHVSVYRNSGASLGRFRGYNLQSYDVVYINTHGITDVSMPNGKRTTALLTGTRITELSERMLGLPLAYLLWKGNKKVYYLITPDAIAYDRPRFNNSWLFMHACNSFTNGDLPKVLNSLGAGACSGYLSEASYRLSVAFAAKYVEALASGMEIGTAEKWSRNNTYSLSDESWVASHGFDFFETIVSPGASPYYLFDPRPFNLKSDVDRNVVNLSWDSPPHAGKYKCTLFINDNPIEAVFSADEERYNYVFNADEPGTYSWYVKTDILLNEEQVNSVKSEEYSFIVEEEGLQAVDLGLSVKWGSCNLGATKPEEYGDYFAWGETLSKGDYSWPTYKWCVSQPSPYFSLTKYCDEVAMGYNGFTDGKTVLEPEDDAAHMNLGGNWRMPTHAEWKELLYCTVIPQTHNGVFGRLVIGPNGNSIFIPAAGRRDETNLGGDGSAGWYWSSTRILGVPFNAWVFAFGSGAMVNLREFQRCSGLSVRPVYAE